MRLKNDGSGTVIFWFEIMSEMWEEIRGFSHEAFINIPCSVPSSACSPTGGSGWEGGGGTSSSFVSNISSSSLDSCCLSEMMLGTLLGPLREK